MVGRSLKLAALMTLAVLTAGLALTNLNLRIPEPTGKFAVGRRTMLWTDPGRPEVHTPESSDSRELPLTIWYPAPPGSGKPAGYLARSSEGLAESGELSRLEVLGLSLVWDHVLTGAEFAPADRVR